MDKTFFLEILPPLQEMEQMSGEDLFTLFLSMRELVEKYPEIDGEENPLMIPLRLAAQKGDPDAMSNLGIRLNMKRQFLQDRVLIQKLCRESEYWMEQARLHGDEFAIFQFQVRAEATWKRRKKDWSDYLSNHVSQETILVHPSNIASLMSGLSDSDPEILKQIFERIL